MLSPVHIGPQRAPDASAGDGALAGWPALALHVDLVPGGVDFGADGPGLGGGEPLHPADLHAALALAVGRAGCGALRSGELAALETLVSWQAPRLLVAAPGPPGLPAGGAVQRVTFLWVGSWVSAATVAALRALAARVSRVAGHAAYVQIAPDALGALGPGGTGRELVPDVDGDTWLRVPRGRCGDASVDVSENSWKYVSYRVTCADDKVAATDRSGGRWVVYRLMAETPLPLCAAVALADAVRGQVLGHAGEPLHPLLSGRGPGAWTPAEHLAVVPLACPDGVGPGVGLCGLSLSLPEGAERAALAALESALRRWEAADAGGAGGESVEVEVYPTYRVALQRVSATQGPQAAFGRAHWSRPSRAWQTVTPVALDGRLRDLGHSNPRARRLAWLSTEKALRRAVARSIRLPDGGILSPSAVRVQLQGGDPAVQGAVPLASVQPFRRSGDAAPHQLVHACIRLTLPLRGPLLVGPGRHVGLGLFRPVG